MAILAFQKPENVVMIDPSDTYAKFEFRPLEPGYGITIGNALRRILLSSLEGYAITSIKIEGVDHEFATIPGVLEDVTNLILNLKQVRFRQIEPDTTEETITLKVAKSDIFKAGDLDKSLSAFKVLNPELPICHLDTEAAMQITIHINKGRGYVTAEENRTLADEINTIAIDSIYTPIRNVKYSVENFRVEQKTDFEKLVLEVLTDGSIHPKDALAEASDILIRHFCLFAEECVIIEEPRFDVGDDMDEEDLKVRQLLISNLEDLDLSVRALNCLESAGVRTLGDLVIYQESDLLKFRNFGKKSLTELTDLLDSLNLTLGMDVSKYKLDK